MPRLTLVLVAALMAQGAGGAEDPAREITSKIPQAELTTARLMELALTTEPTPETADGALVSANVTVVAGTTAAPTAAAAGMVASVDPATGKLRAATVEDLAAIPQLQRKNLEGAELTTFQAEGGAVGLLLDSRFLVSERVTVDEDGQLHADEAFHSGPALVLDTPESPEKEEQP